MLFATIGCSFTRGERLFYHRYVEDDELSTINERHNGKGTTPIPIFGQISDKDGNHMKHATEQDKRFQLDISYTGLLSKRLNCDYITKSGDNLGHLDWVIQEWVKMSRTIPGRKFDFIVLQLTEPQRDLKEFYGGHDGQEFWDKLGSISTPPEEKEKLEHHLEVEIPELTVKKVLEANKLCKDNDIDLLVWSWTTPIAEMLKDEDFFVKIEYEGKEHISYNHMSAYASVSINQVFDSNDTHPNKLFNRVLYDSIIRKLKEKGII